MYPELTLMVITCYFDEIMQYGQVNVNDAVVSTMLRRFRVV